eukprot:577857-Amphidinium_carterae.2
MSIPRYRTIILKCQHERRNGSCSRSECADPRCQSFSVVLLQPIGAIWCDCIKTITCEEQINGLNCLTQPALARLAQPAFAEPSA